MTTNDYNQKQTELENQLLDLKKEREQAEQAARQDKLDKLIHLQQEATEYRAQADAPISDAEKKNLYRFAASADKQANDIRAELGLELNPIEPEPEPVDPTDADRDKANGVINSLLIIALSTGLACILTGYTAAQIDAGLWAFLLDTAAHITRTGFLVSAGLWLSFRAVLWFTPLNYFPVGLCQDFAGAEPRTRLYILAAGALSVLYLLSAIIHAK